jgi:hypothetical protein
MNPDIFGEWLRRQGHRILRSPSSYWHSQGPRVYQAFPYHWVILPPEEELSSLLRQNRAIGLRYSTPENAPRGCISYHAVYEKNTYGLENLGKWARKNVRRGLKNCKIEPITFPRLAEEGWRLQLDTLQRQGRHPKFDQKIWRRLCFAAADLPGFEAWGAMVEGIMAASVITFKMDECAYMLYQQCLREYLPAHINNALSYCVTQEMMQRVDIRSILYGLHSLDAPANVDQFKFRMGYSAKIVRQRVVFNQWMESLFNKTNYEVVKRFHEWFPGNAVLSKTEGMIRFYLEGNLPLRKQNWPDCLRNLDLLGDE